MLINLSLPFLNLCLETKYYLTDVYVFKTIKLIQLCWFGKFRLFTPSWLLLHILILLFLTLWHCVRWLVQFWYSGCTDNYDWLGYHIFYLVTNLSRMIFYKKLCLFSFSGSGNSTVCGTVKKTVVVLKVKIWCRMLNSFVKLNTHSQLIKWHLFYSLFFYISTSMAILLLVACCFRMHYYLP